MKYVFRFLSTYIKFGRDRIVLLLPCFGIVLKIPRVYPLKFLDYLCDYTLCENGKKAHCLMQSDPSRGESYDGDQHPSYHIVRGVKANLNEAMIWERTHHPLLVPTWSIFPGLLIVQPYGIPIEENLAGLQVQYNDLVRKYDCDHLRDGHAFATRNFIRINGKILFADYGSQKVTTAFLYFDKQLRSIEWKQNTEV